jgi:hypothetical protein
MRFVSILALLTLVGCMMKPTSSDDGSGGAGAGAACDGKDSCKECLSCASQRPCAQLISSCLNSATCAGVDQCMAICGSDTPCQQQCLINNPSGAAAYNAVRGCLYCEQCPNDCSANFDCS